MRQAGAGFAGGPGDRRPVTASRGRQSGRALRTGFVLDVAGGNELEKSIPDICRGGVLEVRPLPAPATTRPESSCTGIELMSSTLATTVGLYPSSRRASMRSARSVNERD